MPEGEEHERKDACARRKLPLDSTESSNTEPFPAFLVMLVNVRLVNVKREEEEGRVEMSGREVSVMLRKVVFADLKWPEESERREDSIWSVEGDE